MTGVINLDAPTGEDAIVRLMNGFGCDELNCGGHSYRPDHRGAFHVPRRHVDWALLHIAGFVEQELTLAEGLQDAADAIAELPPGRHRAALSSALAGLSEPGADLDE